MIVLAYPTSTSLTLSRPPETEGLTDRVHTGDPESVEDGQVNVGGGQHDERVADPNPDVQGAVQVHLGRHPQHAHRRHVAGQQRQRHGQRMHVALRHQEVHHRLVLAVAVSLVAADDHGRQQEGGEDDVVEEAELLDDARRDAAVGMLHPWSGEKRVTSVSTTSGSWVHKGGMLVSAEDQTLYLT